jgi:CBS domain-containing protein
VVDGSGKVIGALTDRDITVRVVAQGLPSDGVRVHQIMTSNVIAASKGDDVEQVARQMREHKISRMLVCDDGKKPIGVVSLGDLAERHDEREVGSTLKDVKEGVTLTH